jgi:hypothetical protein
MQINQPEATVHSQFDTMYHRYQLFRALLDTYWHWDETVAETFTHVATTLETLMQDHPTFYDELIAIIQQAAHAPPSSSNTG